MTEQVKTVGTAVVLAIIGAIVTLAQGGGLPLPTSMDPKLAAFLIAIIIAAGTAFIDSLKQNPPVPPVPSAPVAPKIVPPAS